MIERMVHIDKLLKPKKVLILYGARRVGKTTLLKDFLSHSKLKYRIDSGDNIRIQHLFESQDFTALSDYVEGYDLIAIDEAQQIGNIGMGVKILVDQNPSLRIIVTGLLHLIWVSLWANRLREEQRQWYCTPYLC